MIVTDVLQPGEEHTFLLNARSMLIDRPATRKK